jgi:hypothetical protein
MMRMHASDAESGASAMLAAMEAESPFGFAQDRS